MPIPKQTHQMVDGCSMLAAERTMRKIAVASGPPKVKGRFVTNMNTVPWLLRVYASAGSEADVEEAEYSPPVPKPVMPRATVNIHNMSAILVPLAPANSARPIMPEVTLMANFRPRLSHVRL